MTIQFNNLPQLADDEYYVIPVIPMEDPLVHTPEHPFCEDTGCPCHEDSELVGQLGQQVADGLATPADADRIYRGKQV